jgi:hypothetical protein
VSDLVASELAKRTTEHHVFLRSELYFGAEWTAEATHAQRVQRWNDLLRHEWHRKGGTGQHPMEELSGTEHT